MSGKCQKIHIQFLYIHRHMRNTLRSICHDHNSLLMADFCKSPDIVSDTQNIGHLRNCHKFRLICDGISQIFFCNSSLPVTLQIFYHRTCSLGCLLPWKHITVMFHNAYQNFISRLKCHQSIAVCNQIQAFCCISCKNNLFCAFCMNKLTDFFSGSLIFLCCILRSLIESTQRICITVFIKICNRPDHTVWFLGSGRIVQINQILILQHGKIFSYFLDIQFLYHSSRSPSRYS